MATELSLISFDLWDTILLRACHSDEIKISTARYIINRHFSELRPEFQNAERLLIQRRHCEALIGAALEHQGLDGEPRIIDVLDLVLKTSFLDDEAVTPGMVADLVSQEVDHEVGSIRLNSALLERFSKKEAAEHCYISDFYMPEEQLHSIVHRVGAPAYPIFVSCDVRLNKHSGKLFKHVHNRLNVAPQRHLHIGDNPHSDVRVPRSLGIQSVQSRPSKAIKYWNYRVARRYIDFSSYIRELESDLHALRTSGRTYPERAANLGIDYADLFVSFVLFAIENALRTGASTIYYFTREGYFFKDIHRLIAAYNPFGLPLPEAELLKVSRLATFAPSIRSVSCGEFKRIWSQYSKQSARQFAVSLGIPFDELAEHFARFGISPDETISFPFLDDRVKDLLADRSFQCAVQKAVDEKKEALLGYLNQAGFFDGSPGNFIVDIGWRGSIQDNLCHLLPERTISGCYFGLQPYLNVQPHNAVKSAFVPQSASSAIRCTAAIEMLCNAPAESITGYRREEDGCLSAVGTSNPNENAVFETFTAHFQEGVKQAVPVICDFVRRYGVNMDELRPHALEKFRCLMAVPPIAIARAYHQLDHNDEFGLGRFVRAQRHLSPRTLFRALSSRSAYEKLAADVASHSWAEAHLKVTGLAPVLKVRRFVKGILLR